MNFNDRMKVFKRTMARNGLYGSSWLINKLSYSGMRGITSGFIALGRVFTVRQRRLAEDSLRVAFGQEKTEAQRQQIIRQCFENLGRGMVELIYFMDHPRFILDKVTIEGKEHLDRALQEGKGAIAVSAHFGNFPLMLLHLAQRGYKTNAIIRPTRDQEIEKHFLAQRSKLGLNTIYSVPRKECVDLAIKALRNNELVFIPLDQNFGSGAGVFVDFFGQKAATATGPVIFSMRTGAPILPMFVIREKDDTYKVIIEPPMTLEQRQDDKETVVVNVARITKIIENYIRRYPHEWGWMHRRWKSQPPAEMNKNVSLNAEV